MFVPCLLAALVPGAVSAQTRPLQTEEATTAPRGRVVLEVGQDFIKDEPNFLHGQPRNRWDGPILRLVWSPADPVEAFAPRASGCRPAARPARRTITPMPGSSATRHGS